MDHEPLFDVSVGTPDEVREVGVSAYKEEAETVMGLESILVERDNGKPFSVSQYVCSHCGYRDDYAGEETKCHRCHKDLSLKSEKKTEKDISEEETKKIIDNQLVYRCPDCGRVFDKPALCCNGNFVFGRSKEDDPVEGYMCVDCRTVYSVPRRCCSGRMVRGDFYMNPSEDIITKASRAISKPVDIAHFA